MMKTLLFLLVSALLCINSIALACTPSQPERMNARPALVITSDNGQYLLKMIPPFLAKEKGNWVVKRDAYGLAFKVLRNGQLQQIWSAKHLYPGGYFGSKRDFLLSDDGLHLVQLNRVNKVSDTSAFVVYDRGRVGRKFSPSKFQVSRRSLINYPCGADGWIVRNSRFSTYPTNPQNDVVLRGNIISFRTVNGKKWRFDIRREPG